MLAQKCSNISHLKNNQENSIFLISTFSWFA